MTIAGVEGRLVARQDPADCGFGASKSDGRVELMRVEYGSCRFPRTKPVGTVCCCCERLSELPMAELSFVMLPGLGAARCEVQHVT
jgi:hypothetical protein